MQKLTKSIAAIMLTVVAICAAGCKPENVDSDVRVTTYTPQDITRNSALCGADVVVPQGLSLNFLGVCWSTERDPTVEDAYLFTTNWSEPYVCTITGLDPGTNYHVRAYAQRGLEYIYGDDRAFTTKDSSSGVVNANGHAYVDLGLPSGTLWATCNIGANAPEDYGDYFSWGETEPKDTYHWSTYKWCNGYEQLPKYCSISRYGYNGFTDDLTVLLFEDDAAAANWGGDWRMPTREEWNELREYTTNRWITQNGVGGWLFIGLNGATLFLPAAGYRYVISLNDDGRCGDYWSSSLQTESPSIAWCLHFYSSYFNIGIRHDRDCGLSVRAVLPASKNL